MSRASYLYINIYYLTWLTNLFECFRFFLMSHFTSCRQGRSSPGIARSKKASGYRAGQEGDPGRFPFKWHHRPTPHPATHGSIIGVAGGGRCDSTSVELALEDKVRSDSDAPVGTQTEFRRYGPISPPSLARRLGQPLQPRPNIDGVAANALLFDDDIAQLDADAYFDAAGLGYRVIAPGHGGLDRDGTWPWKGCRSLDVGTAVRFP